MTKPESKIESLLLAARENLAQRPSFYRALLDSELLVLATVTDRGAVQGEFIASTDTKIRLQIIPMKDKTFVPFFSSLARVQDYIRTKSSYVRMTGRTLLQMLLKDCPNDIWVLNPNSEFAKEFDPEEAKAMLDGRMFGPRPTKDYGSGQSVYVGEPKEIPTKLLEALISYFRTSGLVMKAWYTQIYVPSTGQPAHIAIAIRLSEPSNSNTDRITQDIGIIHNDTLRGQLMDIATLDQDPLPNSMYGKAKLFFDAATAGS